MQRRNKKSTRKTTNSIEKESKLIAELAIKIEKAKERKVLAVNKIFAEVKRNPKKFQLFLTTDKTSRRIKPDIRTMAKIRLGIMNENSLALAAGKKCKCKNNREDGCICLWCNRTSAGPCNCTGICKWRM